MKPVYGCFCRGGLEGRLGWIRSCIRRRASLTLPEIPIGSLWERVIYPENRIG